METRIVWLAFEPPGVAEVAESNGKTAQARTVAGWRLDATFSLWTFERGVDVMGATETTGIEMTSQIETELESLLPWSRAKEVNTKNGPRFLRKATPTEAFWNAWRTAKDALKAAGISCCRTIDGSDWEVLWWRRLPPDLVAQREEAVEQSRATDAEINVPCPEGLAYMPFQRAGIRFALRLFGVETSTQEGGMPIPSRRDSKGVLIADEMG